MKILLFYTYNKGLLSEFFQELSEKLVIDGHEVFNFYFKNKREFFIQNGVKVYGEKRGGYIYNYKNVYNVIKKTKPDIILSNFSYVNPALLFGRILGVKNNIVWFHTVYEHGRPSISKVCIKTFFLKLADNVIANSKTLQKEMYSIYRVDKVKTHSIPFWTNIQNYSKSLNNLNFNKNPEVLKIGCPGRMLEDKNHQVVINALHHIKNNYSQEIHLYFAGGGTYKFELETLVNSLNLQNQVTFLGVLNVEEMVEFYDFMDVIVLPSMNEAFGLVFIEAIALGIPVIVSSKFGALNHVDPKNYDIDGFAFDPNSVSQLIEKLIPYVLKKGIPGDYFQNLYESTFEKDIIYDRIKEIVVPKKEI